MRHAHHETAMSLGGFIITIAPAVTIMAQSAFAIAKRRKRKARR